MVKVTRLSGGVLLFEDGSKLYDYHEHECCERHYLDWDSVDSGELIGLDFDLSGNKFFERVEDYGIRLTPINGHPISVPGYGYNNGYYSHRLTLVLEKDVQTKKFDISECQDVKD